MSSTTLSCRDDDAGGLVADELHLAAGLFLRAAAGSVAGSGIAGTLG